MYKVYTEHIFSADLPTIRDAAISLQWAVGDSEGPIPPDVIDIYLKHAPDPEDVGEIRFMIPDQDFSDLDDRPRIAKVFKVFNGSLYYRRAAGIVGSFDAFQEMLDLELFTTPDRKAPPSHYHLRLRVAFDEEGEGALFAYPLDLS